MFMHSLDLIINNMETSKTSQDQVPSVPGVPVDLGPSLKALDGELHVYLLSLLQCGSAALMACPDVLVQAFLQCNSNNIDNALKEVLKWLAACSPDAQDRERLQQATDAATRDEDAAAFGVVQALFQTWLQIAVEAHEKDPSPAIDCGMVKAFFNSLTAKSPLLMLHVAQTTQDCSFPVPAAFRVTDAVLHSVPRDVAAQWALQSVLWDSNARLGTPEPPGEMQVLLWREAALAQPEQAVHIMTELAPLIEESFLEGEEVNTQGYLLKELWQTMAVCHAGLLTKAVATNAFCAASGRAMAIATRAVIAQEAPMLFSALLMGLEDHTEPARKACESVLWRAVLQAVLRKQQLWPPVLNALKDLPLLQAPPPTVLSSAMYHVVHHPDSDLCEFLLPCLKQRLSLDEDTLTDFFLEFTHNDLPHPVGHVAAFQRLWKDHSHRLPQSALYDMMLYLPQWDLQDNEYYGFELWLPQALQWEHLQMAHLPFLSSCLRLAVAALGTVPSSIRRANKHCVLQAHVEPFLNALETECRLAAPRTQARTKRAAADTGQEHAKRLKVMPESEGEMAQP